MSKHKRLVIDFGPGHATPGYWSPGSIELRRDGETFLLISVSEICGDKHVIIYDDPERNPVLTFQIAQKSLDNRSEVR